ncbi:MAG: flagellar motor protein [Methylotenera sp.]|nr:flagellar motor protein [Oligoflexia bacterium]
MIDLASILGLVIGVAAVLGGQLLEGGTLGQILQGTAALIVLGGTLGAVLVSFPMEEVMHAFRSIPSVFRQEMVQCDTLVSEIGEIATVARKEGLLAVDSQISKVSDPLLKKCLKHVVDGFDANAIREIIDAEIELGYEKDVQAAKVFEAAGGYAPTIGIIGAVLGLIHVMTLLNEPAKIGEGIAVAFVATVYGVALSNLILIPIGTKLKRRAQQNTVSREVIKQGVIGIQEGINPFFLQEKLSVFLRREKK